VHPKPGQQRGAQRFAEGKVSFKLAVNKYADMLHHEFRALMNGFNYTLHKELR